MSEYGVEFEAGTMSRDTKIIIAQEARANGVKATAQKHGIPMHVVRAWVGAYCRKPKPRIVSEVATKRTYKKRSSASIITNRNGLPSFPEFSDKWSPEVQVEWISVFLDLAKLNSGADIQK